MAVLMALRNFFEVLLNLALTALPVMAAVLAARWVLEAFHAPRRVSYALWAAVGFRLCCPVTLSSAWSIFNAVRPVADATAWVHTAGTGAVNFSTVDYGSVLPTMETLAPLTGVGSDNILSVSRTAPVEIVLRIAAVIWLAGLTAIVIYSAVSYLRLRRRLADAVCLDGNAYQAGGITTPFVLGFLHPKIYVPLAMEEGEQDHILLHERTHLHRGDPWWKLLGFGILSVYWWNPAAWLCWTLFCRDMEMSCDEAVLRALGPEVKRAYSLSLVSFAAAQRFPSANPLAFGESDAKSRVKNVLRWKQARTGIVFLAVCLCLGVAAVCCTNAENRSWVKLEQPQNGPGVAFTCNLAEPIQSWAIYEDVYENGTLISSVPRISDGFSEDGTGAASRKFSSELTDQTVSDADSGFAGTLNCAAMGVNWDIALPKDHYTGCGSIVGDTDEKGGAFKQHNIAAGSEQLLLSVCFSTDASGGIYTEPLKNAAVVQFRLVTSVDSAEQFASSSYAETLFALKTPYVGEMPADGEILKALGVPELGAYTVELFTSKEPYILQVNFTDEPEDIDPTSPSLDGAMRGKAAILLALIDNLEQVNWTYPSREDGVTMLMTVAFTREDADVWAQSAGYADVRTMGETVEGVEKLLNYASSAGTVGTLTAQSVDSGAPYPASYGRLVQFAADLPTGAYYTLSAVTYINGQLLGETELTGGSTDDLGGAFWLSCDVNKGAWDAVNWALYPYKDTALAVEMASPLTGHAASYAAADFSTLGQNAEGTAQAISSRTALAAVCLSAGGASAEIVPCENLTDRVALQKFGADNAAVVAVYLNITAAPGANGSAVSETAFTDILGYDGTVRETAEPNGFVTRDYAAVIDGTEHVIASSWGYTEDSDYAVDLDGDGVKELVCNVTYGADGVQEVLVYRRQGKWTVCGSLTTDGLPSDFSNWGANATWSEYDPAANVFRLHYCVEGQEKFAVRESTGYDHMEFYNFHE